MSEAQLSVQAMYIECLIVIFKLFYNGLYRMKSLHFEKNICANSWISKAIHQKADSERELANINLI